MPISAGKFLPISRGSTSTWTILDEGAGMVQSFVDTSVNLKPTARMTSASETKSLTKPGVYCPVRPRLSPWFSGMDPLPL